MAERDPLTDPRPGDVVRSLIRERHVRERSDCYVFYRTMKLNGELGKTVCVWIRTWRVWCRKTKATVVERGLP
jgi:hypothetical protein